MKRTILVATILLLLSAFFACNAMAENWILYAKSDLASGYYDPNMSYSRDEVGETPYIQVRLRMVRKGAPPSDRTWLVDPDVTMLKPLTPSGNIMMMGFEGWNSFKDYDFRLVAAIKQWKQTHQSR